MNNSKEETSEFNPNHEEKRFEATDSIEKNSDGWLSPEGMFYHAGPEEHNECAKFVLANDLEIQERKEKFHWDRHESPRMELEQNGYVLVNGPILPTYTTGNLTETQLKILEKAGVTILDPSTNIEIPTELAINSIEQSKEKLSEFKKLAAYSESLSKVKGMLEAFKLDSSDLTSMSAVEITHRYNEYKREHPGEEVPNYFNAYLLYDQLHQIELFHENPLTNKIYLRLWERPINKELSDNLFDQVSEGYEGGVKIKKDRNEYNYRILPTTSKDIKLLVYLHYYFHDGQSGDADTNHYLGVTLLQNAEVLEKIGDILEADENTPEATVSFEKESEVLNMKNIFGRDS